MRIGEPSFSSRGTQVVIDLRLDPCEEGRYVYGDKEWPRFLAMSIRVAKDLEISGTFISADVKHFLGGLTQVQLSWILN